jgi:triacylglycerol esterase/lipase EstA (alpha/beta hydrolase family)
MRTLRRTTLASSVGLPVMQLLSTPHRALTVLIKQPSTPCSTLGSWITYVRVCVFISTVAAIFAVITTSCASVNIPSLPVLPAQEVVSTTHIPYPILLLHGLGQKAAVWDAQAVRFYEQEGLRFGGVLKTIGGRSTLEFPSSSTSSLSPLPSASSSSSTSSTSQQQGYADFFTVAFSNPVDSVGAWKRELEQHVRLVRERTKADKIILIGYSMGGLTGRYYLTQHLNDHHVQRLITIGSPHQGSPFAKVWKWKTSLINAQKNANPLLAAVLSPAVNAVKSLERDVPFDAPAIRDLMRPEDGGEFTKRVGALPHPSDVEYVSVVGRVEVLKELQALSASGVQELVRRGLEAIGFGMDAAFADGDGVVSAKSQTINELPWFQADRSRQRISQTITLNTVHEDHLRNSTEIQRISLDAKPEFKGAEFYRVSSVTGASTTGTSTTSGTTIWKPCLTVEFVDYLPPQLCTVECVLQASSSNVAGQRLAVSKENIKLIRKPNGAIVAQALCFLPDTASFSRQFDVAITVTNTFGKQFSVTKQWIPR